MNVEDIRRVAADPCREFDVLRLDLFGSVARQTPHPSSDVDLLVEFRDPDREPARRFFGLMHRLETLFQCEVDLLTTNSLRNPYFRQRVLREKVPVYEG